ncbi:ATP-grasp domain-containing protein [Vibrio vulnificus]|uniref:ATP-grasp domain-containing protein n=1 Tax=Vibrio vulnificus TaxID=672 RepID=A0A2S3R608_VIBVL|nr:ATP-grasp domain-containing protein [Vibrio vulnificus]ELP6757203.1 ATP-grasp domain-containing protein [Vibrio vulnificus]MDK2620912.1 ATP-grasp domain-containing protein [Vibrio vulnificus]POB49142.1 hypothetical protein CRN52_06640 [Vibrio vulnificus]RAH20238.1 ATP-grasp domain-containing protein [Vibrio vulnificus]HDY7707646.1 ATP-grasp domain-containing protein [Vibrio vulnificus]
MNLLVLGGSYLQSDFVYKAMESGYSVYVCDGDKECYLSADRRVDFVHLDFSDYSALKEFSIDKQIEFVFAPCGEYSNEVASRLSDDLGLKYNSFEATIATRSKSRQRDILKKHSYFSVIKSEQLTDSLDVSEFNFPVVVKPEDSSGGRGVLLVRRLDDIEYSYEYAKAFGSGTVLIEEYIQGEQISIETLSMNGQHRILAFTNEIVSSGPNFIERSHTISSAKQAMYFDELGDGIIELLDIFNIQWGASHIEMILATDGTYRVIEVASRSGGWRDKLFFYASNHSMNQSILDAVIAEELTEFDCRQITLNSAVNILLTENDLSQSEHFKELEVERFFNGKKFSDCPQNLIDAVGYIYFSSEQSLESVVLDREWSMS